MLRRFWLEFEESNENKLPPGVSIGCGVCAFDFEDALKIIDEKVFKNLNRPRLIKKIENVDIRELDQAHVIPNMKPPIERGIWFPLGYD